MPPLVPLCYWNVLPTVTSLAQARFRTLLKCHLIRVASTDLSVPLSAEHNADVDYNDRKCLHRAYDVLDITVNAIQYVCSHVIVIPSRNKIIISYYRTVRIFYGRGN